MFILAGVAQGQRVGLQDRSKGRLRPWGSALQREARAHHKQNKQIIVKVLVHQENIPEKGGVSMRGCTQVWLCPSQRYSQPEQPMRPRPLISVMEHPDSADPAIQGCRCPPQPPQLLLASCSGQGRGTTQANFWCLQRFGTSGFSSTKFNHFTINLQRRKQRKE